MADVNTIPQIRCDNCGLTVEKIDSGVMQRTGMFIKPRSWGSCKMEGGRSTDSYGGKARLDFGDLCPECANAALDAAAEALKARREED